jgi:hypothetical protein
MTIGHDPSNIWEIKVKTFSLTNRQLLTILGIKKNDALELTKLQELYESSPSIQRLKPDIVYICKTADDYERCVLLDSEELLTKSFTVLLIDNKSELQVSPEQVSAPIIISSSSSPLIQSYVSFF